MINRIFDAISSRLDAVYELPVYGDKDVEQGLNEPCFFVASLNPAQRQLIGQRYRRSHPFDIHYFPESSGNYPEMLDVGSRLMVDMLLIEDSEGTKYRGSQMSFEITDGVLHFFVTYPEVVRIYPKDDPVTMQELEETITAKET